MDNEQIFLILPEEKKGQRTLTKTLDRVLIENLKEEFSQEIGSTSFVFRGENIEGNSLYDEISSKTPLQYQDSEVCAFISKNFKEHIEIPYYTVHYRVSERKTFPYE